MQCPLTNGRPGDDMDVKKEAGKVGPAKATGTSQRNLAFRGQTGATRT